MRKYHHEDRVRKSGSPERYKLDNSLILNLELHIVTRSVLSPILFGYDRINSVGRCEIYISRETINYFVLEVTILNTTPKINDNYEVVSLHRVISYCWGGGERTRIFT